MTGWRKRQIMAAEGTIKAEGTFTLSGITKAVVGDISIMDDNKVYKFQPQEDMTGYEAALIAQMFSIASMASRSMTLYDYMGFIEQHNLTRHFKEQ
jgi:hypothetical protein